MAISHFSVVRVAPETWQDASSFSCITHRTSCGSPAGSRRRPDWPCVMQCVANRADAAQLYARFTGLPVHKSGPAGAWTVFAANRGFAVLEHQKHGGGAIYRCDDRRYIEICSTCGFPISSGYWQAKNSQTCEPQSKLLKSRFSRRTARSARALSSGLAMLQFAPDDNRAGRPTATASHFRASGSDPSASG